MINTPFLLNQTFNLLIYPNIKRNPFGIIQSRNFKNWKTSLNQKRKKRSSNFEEYTNDKPSIYYMVIATLHFEIHVHSVRSLLMFLLKVPLQSLTLSFISVLFSCLFFFFITKVELLCLSFGNRHGELLHLVFMGTSISPNPLSCK